ncbi:SGS domain-containing protein [Striga asiatica]|uniref:Calcyclin-binding protein n=1 Tax=Striga asiatica TaxID=4170 RepID=A0A5A7QBV1_STRAF|nr:SGS domain-containing protein [Striga asiatica]
MANSEDLALDLEELKQIQSIAKRPRVISLISSEIRNLEKLLKEIASAPTVAPVSTISPPNPISTAPNPLLSYTTLSSFSWDQDNDHLKIYVSLEGVDREKIEADFKTMSCDIKFHDVQGKNYRCAVPKLNKGIVPDHCKFVVKPKRVVITLVKASKGNWLDLHFKEDKLKPNLDKEEDPMAGIMGLMKNMYEEGDEDMKRTIAKAWTDARSGKTADPLQSPVFQTVGFFVAVGLLEPLLDNLLLERIEHADPRLLQVFITDDFSSVMMVHERRFSDDGGRFSMVESISFSPSYNSQPTEATPPRYARHRRGGEEPTPLSEPADAKTRAMATVSAPNLGSEMRDN